MSHASPNDRLSDDDQVEISFEREGDEDDSPETTESKGQGVKEEMPELDDEDVDLDTDLALLRSRVDRLQDILKSTEGDIDEDPEPRRKPKPKKRKPKPHWTLRLLRILVLDLPLVLSFGLLLTVYAMRVVHQEYYQVLFDRARRTDTDLYEEFTYYERQCNEFDLSTRDASDLLLQVHDDDNDTTDAGVQTMLTHGALVIPSLLQADTVKELRRYIQHRNAVVTADEAYPVSQGERRVSYGIDATEDPAVSRALYELSNHPTLRPIMQALLGDEDPASAEITAITAFAGATHQIWHPDTKPDGNALKFARTYSHSYSLFLPLQDTTEAMGATDLCPGTQYCSNNLSFLCKKTKMGLHLAGPNGQYFPAGHGALLNQHLWHRGTAHTDSNAPERIVFIVSFLARPHKANTMDVRQLSRGTYFHQKWNMWGHTWKDLMNLGGPNDNSSSSESRNTYQPNALVSMQWPISYLRALSLWKPKSCNWGYDLVTAVYMRFSNGQLESDELSTRFARRMEKWNFPPEWLRGRILRRYDSQKQQWETFIKETLEKAWDFLFKVNGVVHAVFFILMSAVAVVIGRHRRGSGARLLISWTWRVIWTHAGLLLLVFWMLHRVRTSAWGQAVLHGRYLMRPFPPVELAKESDAVRGSLTTFPTRRDVLLGTRYDAKFLGSYNQWLDRHPANAEFYRGVEARANLYRQYTTASGGLSARPYAESIFSDQLQAQTEELVATRGRRFLHQDHRTGDWRLLSNVETKDAIRREFYLRAHPILHHVFKETSYLIATQRFGFFRHTLLAQWSVRDLMRLQNERLLKDLMPIPRKRLVVSNVEAITDLSSTLKPSLSTTSYLPQPAPSTSHHGSRNFASRSQHPQMKKIDKKTDFRVGDLVWCSSRNGQWAPASILEVQRGTVTLAYDDGTQETKVRTNRLHPYQAITEGDRVKGCFGESDEEDFVDCYPGRVGRVMPSGRVMIAYDDGDVEWDVPPYRYYRPPFKYAWEYY